MEDLSQKEKAELVTELSAVKGDPLVQKVLRLATIYIEEARKNNDDALVKSVLRNQGEIRGLKRLVSAITRGLPGEI